MTEVNEINVETAVPANLAEWLLGYFDGGRHHLGGRANVLFPAADVAFGQGRPRQPLSAAAEGPGLEIRCVTLNAGNAPAKQWAYDARDWSGKLAEDALLLQFQVRARLGSAPESQLLTAQAAQLLHALLNNATAKEPLIRAGVAQLQAWKPEVVPSTDYALRLVHCRARLIYAIWLLHPDETPVLHDADGNRYTLRVVTSAEGVPQLELSAPITPADNLVLVDETGAAFRVNVATDAGAAQMDLAPTDAPGQQSLTLRAPDGHPYVIRVTRAAGVPQLAVAD